jgi:glycosyltransferase involved in cell wall biosynthesis
MKQQKNVRPAFLSLVMPAYKAEKFIEKNILQVKAILDELPYNYELIIVADGMLDKTVDKASKFAKKYPEQIIATGYQNNMGKGHAVRFGMARAKGDIIGFIDDGFNIDPSSISMALQHFDWYKADIVVGSKRHPASKVFYPWQRRILSLGYQLLVRLLFGVKVRDTQVGLKLFKREVLEKTLPRLLVKEFAMDIELLSVANYLGYKRVYEFPVELHMDFAGFSVASKGFINSVMKTLWDTSAVFYRLRILHYYDTKNKSKWITPEYLILKVKS